MRASLSEVMSMGADRRSMSIRGPSASATLPPSTLPAAHPASLSNGPYITEHGATYPRDNYRQLSPIQLTPEAMADILDFADDQRLAKKFDSLSALFSRFNFPSRPHHYASRLEIDYWNVVRDLDAIDPQKLDEIAKDCSEVFELRELELRFSMEVEDVESESWLKEFIHRLDVAKQESTDSLADDFSSQTVLSQEDPAPSGN
jgi:hypothetical protein